MILLPSSASRPPGLRIVAIFSSASCGSTHWNDDANTTRSNVLPTGCQFSNVACSTRMPLAAATPAIRSSGSTAVTCAPAADNWADAIPVPAPTSRTRSPPLMTSPSMSACG